jgi:hypothetical protein
MAAGLNNPTTGGDELLLILGGAESIRNAGNSKAPSLELNAS